MFSRSRRDPDEREIIDNSERLEILNDFNDEDVQVLESLPDEPEIVQIVEKISGILSPYFIVLVGLLLHKETGFIGTVLIFIGILSLLKISWQDIAYFIEGFKSFLGLGKSPDDTIS